MDNRQVLVNRASVLAQIRENAILLRAYGARRLGLFGSVVRNEARFDSDVDLVVEFETGKKTFDNFMGLANALEELFHRKIELITIESLSPYLRPYILREIEYVTLVA